MNMLEERLRKGLAAEADARPLPTKLPQVSTSYSVKGARVAMAAAAVILVVVGGTTLISRAIAPIEPGSAVGAMPLGVSTTSVSTSVPSTTFPHLALDLADTTVFDAYDVIDEATGDRVGTHTIYHTTLTDGTYGYTGRVVLLRIQAPGTEFVEFDHYAPLAQSTETVVVDGREVTVYLIPDEEIDEGTYDLGILQWTESPDYEVVLIPWGLDTDGALSLMSGLTTISQSDWIGLSTLETASNPAGTSTIVDSALTPLMPRVVIDLPDFEIVGGSEAQDGPAHWHGEWQIRIGDTTGTITLDSSQTAPSEAFIGYDTPKSVMVAGTPGLLGQHAGGFVVEWELDDRITVSIDGTDLDPNDVIAAITYVEEATWIDLLSNTTR